MSAHNAFALVGALTLGYWTLSVWRFAMRWWEAFFARQAAKQRDAQRVEDAAEASRLMAKLRAERGGRWVPCSDGSFVFIPALGPPAFPELATQPLVSQEREGAGQFCWLADITGRVVEEGE